MKRCPLCQQRYDDSLSFCTDDGTSLLSADIPRFDPHADTLVLPESQLIKTESALEHAAAELDRKLKFKSERSRWYNSEKGVTSAGVEVDNLHKELEGLVNDVHSKSEKLQIKFTKTGGNCMLFSLGVGLNVNWIGGGYKYADILEGWELSITVFDQARFFGGKPRLSRTKHEESYVPDLDEDYRIGWRKQGNKQFLTSNELANECLKLLLHYIKIQ